MPDRVHRKDVRILVTAVAQFAASFEAQLRQIEPALTLSQLVALERIAQNPGLRPFQLATQMRISRQLAWQTCKRLEALGLLAMSNMGAGKRGIEVEATAAGTAHLRQVTGLHGAIAAALEARDQGIDLVVLRTGLQRLAAATGRLPESGEAESGDEAAATPRRPRVRKDAGGTAQDASEAQPPPPSEPADRPKRRAGSSKAG